MKHYNLDEDEVPLYKGKVSFKGKSVESELVLTNKKFVFISDIQNEFMSDVVFVDEFLVGDVKQYQGNYQVIRKGNVVEIYFLHNEVEFVFEKSSECQKFMNEALKLLTGKNKFERGAEKFFKGKDCVDNSLHIDSSAIAKKAVDFFTTKKSISLPFGKKKDK